MADIGIAEAYPIFEAMLRKEQVQGAELVQRLWTAVGSVEDRAGRI